MDPAAQQFKRYCKIFTDPFYVLESGEGEPNGEGDGDGDRDIRLEVSGSTGNPYSVRLRVATGALTCTCMDARLNCGRLGVACKHACFAVARVWGGAGVPGLPSASSRSARGGVPPMPSLRTLPMDAVRRIVEQRAAWIASAPSAADVLADRIGRVSLSSSEDKAAAGGIDFETVLRPPEPGDDCPVCYCELARELVGCPDCGKAVHRECARRWLAHARQPTCVYCRSEVWRSFSSSRARPSSRR